jgi:predicted nucleotidyltransferase
MNPGCVVTPQDSLDEAIRRLVGALHPERIYLFGSRARGDSRSDSDYDLVVVADLRLDPDERAYLANRSIRDLGVPIDVLVYTPVEFERLSTWKSSVVAAALREGTVVYEAA